MTPHTVDMGTGQLLCALADGVAKITLKRPDKRNALSDEPTPALRQTLLVLEADPAHAAPVGPGGLLMRQPADFRPFVDAVFHAMWVAPRNLNDPARRRQC